jgi:hypothetical protein
MSTEHDILTALIRVQRRAIDEALSGMGLT